MTILLYVVYWISIIICSIFTAITITAITEENLFMEFSSLIPNTVIISPILIFVFSYFIPISWCNTTFVLISVIGEMLVLDLKH